MHSAWLESTGQSRVDTRLATVGAVPTGVLTSGSGIVPDGGFGLTPTAPMQCQINAGRAFVQGLTAQGGYQIASDAAVALTVPDGDPQYGRIDVVVLQVQDQEFDTSGQTQAAVVLIEGTPAPAPVAPAIPPASIGLFQIVVPTRISAGNPVNGVTGVAWSTAVTDLRVYTTGLGGILPAAPAWTPPMPGQYADVGGELNRWNGTAWTPVYDPIATGGNLPQVTSSTRPANPPAGKLVYETDSGAVALYSGSAWQHQPGVIARQVLTYASTGIVFTGIPQVYRDLRLVITAKSSGTGTSGADPTYLRFNGDTGSTNYNWNSYSATQAATSVTVANGWDLSAAQCASVWNSYYPTAGRGVITIDIPNYADTNNTKVFLGRSSATDAGGAGILQTFCGGWHGTAGITSITLTLTPTVGIIIHPALSGIGIPIGNTFLPGSVATLYGLG